LSGQRRRYHARREYELRSRPAPEPSRPRLKPSATAELNAAERACEMHQPPARRLFEDPFAQHFIQRPMFRVACARPTLARLSLRLFDRAYGGNHAQVILRNRVYEDELDTALDDGVDQVVLLGAGHDTTAFRRDLGRVTLYEVDTEHTQGAKLAAIERARLEPRSPVVYVPCDFEVQRPSSLLAERGFDAGRRSLVVWYGVMYYLTKAAVRQTLEEIAALSAPGGRLVCDYVDAAVLTGTTPWPGARRAYRGLERRGEPHRFGLTPEAAAPLLAEYGFSVRENLRVKDLAERYAPPGGVWCRTDDWFGTLVAEYGAHT
jgi:methyltransferase (TIGR00027 family)